MARLPLTIIESPYAGNTAQNAQYARFCMLDCIQRGEAPFASHLLYPQVLADTKLDERMLGITLGQFWMHACDQVAVYVDLGVSEGMQAGIDMARHLGKPLHMRNLPHFKLKVVDGPAWDIYINDLMSDALHSFAKVIRNGEPLDKSNLILTLQRLQAALDCRPFTEHDLGCIRQAEETGTGTMAEGR